MQKLKFIAGLHSFGKTISERDLILQQRFRLFRINTLFALVVFVGILCQVSMSKSGHAVLPYLVSALFISVFVNYFALGVHKKPQLAFSILVFLLFAVLHALSYGQGGIRNSGMFYLASIILTAYILLGKRGGKIMAWVSIVHIVYFYIISVYTNWADYSLIGTEPGYLDMDFFFSGTISILVLTAQANYIEKSKNAVVEDIQSKRDELAAKNSELLNAQQDLVAKNRELEQKNVELEQFAYVASHDLQEPLRTTTSFAELLQRQYKEKLDDKAGTYLNYITQSSKRMGVLITDLLDYSRIGRQKQVKRVDCKEVLDDVLADLDIAIRETGTEVRTGPLPVLNGYPTEIKLLFQNLIFNSIKFRRKGEQPRIAISACDTDNGWQFSFADNGIGIPREHNEKIFTIFQRLHTRSEYEGSGIGLSHCKKIVELHQGRIWLDSELGKGTTFYFTIAHNTNR